MEIIIQANSSATVYVSSSNGAKIVEDGSPVLNLPGITFLKNAKDATVFKVEAGIFGGSEGAAKLQAVKDERRA